VSVSLNKIYSQSFTAFNKRVTLINAEGGGGSVSYVYLIAVCFKFVVMNSPSPLYCICSLHHLFLPLYPRSLPH
jgi:hypothetical protein